ncbi:hypothetical protein [Sphingomonas japonica]|uniref:Transposase n=1 Tax=Sphingomonas japonica TaxID=511662 RepID=A0ABX0TVZ3_9SPHN|nr:hypothetical protein [Sphingomonas japonica]NIJ22493.1 hypothetical protein [Sphingomonas japonica]
MNDVEPDDTETELLRRAWPDGVPDAETRLLRSLTAQRRAKVIARLGALLEIEEARRSNPNAHVDLRTKAAAAGVTTDGLFAIRRKWEASRSLVSIAPYLGRAERQPTQRDEDDPVVVAARTLIAGMPGSPDSVLASRLRQQFGTAIPNMIRLVRRLRRDEATVPDRIGGTFGRALLVDLSAIDRVTTDQPAVPIVCAVVIERASGLILGAAVEESGGDTLTAQVAAVREAIAFVSKHALDVAGDISAVELTIGDGPDAAEAFAAAERLKREGVDLRVNSSGPRRYGQRLVSQLGKRLGRLWWRPRFTAPGSEPSKADLGNAIAVADAAVLIAGEVEDHNGEILAALAEGGIAPGWGKPDGAMAAALRRVLAVLGQPTRYDLVEDQ